MTEQRKYSVDEIDRLRRIVEQEWLFGRGPVRTGFSRSYRSDEKAVAVEAMLRTYMFNGTDPEELERAVYGLARTTLPNNQEMGT